MREEPVYRQELHSAGSRAGWWSGRAGDGAAWQAVEGSRALCGDWRLLNARLINWSRLLSTSVHIPVWLWKSESLYSLSF